MDSAIRSRLRIRRWWSAPEPSTRDKARVCFRRRQRHWTQNIELVADDGATGEDFGYAVAVLDNTIIVGADRATVNGNTQQGAAYIFAASNGTWTQTQKLTASDGAADEFYGAFVGLSDQAALVGVPYATVDGNAVQGAAYFYARDDVANDTIFADGFDGAP